MQKVNIEKNLRAQLFDMESFTNGSPLSIDSYGMTEEQVLLVTQIYSEIIVKERLETHVHLCIKYFSREPIQDELIAKESSDRLVSKV